MGHGKWVYNRSSLLTSLPALIGLALLSMLCAAVNLHSALVVLVPILLLAALARLWASSALHGVSVQISHPTGGVFPGQQLPLRVQIRNDKLLPLTWLELFFPLEPNQCLTPRHLRAPDEWELATLKAEGWSTRQEGVQRMSFCGWYETLDTTVCWQANRRGLYSCAGWRLRTGDGLGLTQVECRLSQGAGTAFAVYPALVPVDPAPLLRNLWNADTGSRGGMEDTTLLRSTRSYQPGDNPKHINWRLAARNLPLSVNLYEDILPRSLHFLVDGESFGGENPDWDGLEEALSVLASVLVALNHARIPCGLSLCRGSSPAVHIDAATDNLPALLRALAGYRPLPPLREEATNRVLLRQADFALTPLFAERQRVGRFYYLTRSTGELTRQPVLQRMDPSALTLLTGESRGRCRDFPALSLSALRKGAAT